MAKVGRKSKPLLLRVLENNFRAASHGHLLATEPIPYRTPVEGATPDALDAWATLRDLSERYRAAGSLPTRRRIAVAFGVEVRKFHDALTRTDIPVREQMYATLGPSGRDVRALLPDEPNAALAWRRVRQAWEEWEREYGVAWRLAHDCPTASDKLFLTDDFIDDDAYVPDPPMFEEFQQLQNAR